jgi:hypothetical protein
LSAGGLALALTPAEARAEPLPKMTDRAPVLCMRDAKGEMWRVQCDEGTKRCLYAADAETDEDGKRVRPLDRIETCTGDLPSDLEARAREGYVVTAAIAPAPYGWMRDERGRVFQYNFDLHRRLYVGGGFAPSFADGKEKNRGYVDFSLLQYEGYSSQGSPIRHRLRLLEGEIKLAPFAAEAVALRYDVSERRRDPLLRLTTFVGKPRRGDLTVNGGMFLELARVEVLPVPDRSNATVVRWVTLDGTLDLWQSRDLYSYVRLRAGGSFERSSFGDVDKGALSPNAAAEADVTLDRDGFHRVTAFAGIELPQYYDTDRGFGGHARRLKAELGYEVIVLAVNDQPITFRIAGNAQQRDDIPGLPSTVAFAGTAGLRFNLWAPAREP